MMMKKVQDCPFIAAVVSIVNIPECSRRSQKKGSDFCRIDRRSYIYAQAWSILSATSIPRVIGIHICIYMDHEPNTWGMSANNVFVHICVVDANIGQHTWCLFTGSNKGTLSAARYIRVRMQVFIYIVIIKTSNVLTNIYIRYWISIFKVGTNKWS